MARTNPYDSPEWRSVKLEHPSGSPKFLYLFKSKVPFSEVGELGQQKLETTPESGAIITAAKYPTPLQVRHPIKGIDTKCSTDSFDTAKTRGWKRKKRPQFQGKRVQDASDLGPTSQGALLVYVKCQSGAASKNGTINFAWMMPKWQYRKISDTDRAALGITLPNKSSIWKTLCLNVGNKKSGPRPARARMSNFSEIAESGGIGDIDTTETFYADGASLPENWSHSADPIFLEI